MGASQGSHCVGKFFARILHWSAKKFRLRSYLILQELDTRAVSRPPTTVRKALGTRLSEGASLRIISWRSRPYNLNIKTGYGRDKIMHMNLSQN